MFHEAKGEVRKSTHRRNYLKLRRVCELVEVLEEK